LVDATPDSVPEKKMLRLALNEVAELSDAAIIKGAIMELGDFAKIEFLDEQVKNGEGTAQIKVSLSSKQ